MTTDLQTHMENNPEHTATSSQQVSPELFDVHFLDMFPGQVYLKNADGQFTYVNPAIESAYQCSDDQFLGLNIEQTPFSTLAPCYKHSDSKALELGYFECIEPIMDRGKLYSAYSKKILMRDDKQNAAGLLTFLEPIQASSPATAKDIRELTEIPMDSFIAKTFFHGLTNRESEVLYLMVRGQSAHTIAGTLGLSQRTVIGYIDNMKARLTVNSKQELIQKAFDMGFIFFTPERFRDI